MVDNPKADNTPPACSFCASEIGDDDDHSAATVFTSDTNDAVICDMCIMRFAEDIVDIADAVSKSHKGTRH